MCTELGDQCHDDMAKSKLEKQTTITGAFTASTGTQNFVVKQNGKVVSVNGFVSGATLTAWQTKTLGTISGVSLPPAVIRTIGGVAAQAYQHPEDVAYIGVGTNGEVTVLSNQDGSKAVYFNLTYIVD